MLARLIKDASLRYLTDSQGQCTAVVVDIQTWNKVVEALEDIEDAQEMRLARDEKDELIRWQQVVAEYRTEHPDANV